MSTDYNNQVIYSIVKEAETNYKTDLKERVFRFAIDSLKILMTLQNKKELEVIKNQFSKSATAIGANYEEAQSSSEKEFIHKLRIALREANESRYWLRIINELKIGDINKIQTLLKESQEISLILGSIVSKLDRKLNK